MGKGKRKICMLVIFLFVYMYIECIYQYMIFFSKINIFTSTPFFPHPPPLRNV